MTIIQKLEFSHLAFLQNLPDERKGRVLFKVLILGFVGFVLSFVSVLVILLTTKYNPKNPDNWKYLLLILSQDLPFFIITLLLFYHDKIKGLFLQLFPKVLYKSPILILAVLIISLSSGICMNLTNFFFSNSKDVLIKYLSEYINSGPDKITINYLYIFLQSVVIFLFIAFFEEFIFRFTIFRFSRKRGLLFALIISSVLFAIIHNSNGFLSALFTGVILALYYEYTNNFWGAVIIHALENLFVVYYSYYFAYLILR